MTKEVWAKLNLPESHLRRIKSNAALAGMSMVKYVAGLVENDEQKPNEGGSPSKVNSPISTSVRTAK